MALVKAHRRMLDDVAPTSHTHEAEDISDSTATGRSVLTAVNAAAVRTLINAAEAGVEGAPPAAHTHVVADLDDATATGVALMTAADAAAARTAISAPSATGSGASGTWNVSVTGNAANVTGTVAIANGGTGATTAAAARTALGLDTPTVSQLTVSGFGTAPLVDTLRAQGSSGSPTDVASGNNISYVQGRAYFNGGYRTASYVTTLVDGAPTPGGTAVPARFSVQLSDGTGAPAEKLRLTKDGKLAVGFAGAPSVALHVEGATDPEVRVRETGAHAASYVNLKHISDGLAAIDLANGAAGTSTIELTPAMADGTSAGYVRVGRFSSSSGGVQLEVARGDNSATIDHRLKSGTSASSFIAGNGGKVGIGLNNPAVTLDVGGTDAFWLPSGTSAQRPSSPGTGMMRTNSDKGYPEVYTDGWWQPLGTNRVCIERVFLGSSPSNWVTFTGIDGWNAWEIHLNSVTSSVNGASFFFQFFNNSSYLNTNYDYTHARAYGTTHACTTHTGQVGIQLVDSVQTQSPVNAVILVSPIGVGIRKYVFSQYAHHTNTVGLIAGQIIGYHTTSWEDMYGFGIYGDSSANLGYGSIAVFGIA